MGSALPLTIVGMLLLYLPYRLSRGFPMTLRMAVLMIVATKAVLITVVHLSHVSDTGHPIILDESVDAKRYYDFGTAFLNHDIRDIGYDDLIRERGASAHLGYYVVNLVAFKFCPAHPMLFLRLAKLLLFHVGLGMLATTWRLQTTTTRAFIGYIILGAIYYQFAYHHFRNAKDDVVLSIFLMIMAVTDRTVAATGPLREKLNTRKMMTSWVIIALLTWLISSFRFYMGLALVIALAMHTVTGRSMKVVHRVLFVVVVGVGFVLFMRSGSYALVDERGGVGAALGGLSNVYGMFAVFTRPIPWQHANRLLGIPHTVYLLLLIPALWALISDFRNKLDWKLYLVGIIAMVVGGFMQDPAPRKRFIMYPIFTGWVLALGAGRKRGATEPFDPNAYFAQSSDVYAELPAVQARST